MKAAFKVKSKGFFFILKGLSLKWIELTFLEGQGRSLKLYDPFSRVRYICHKAVHPLRGDVNNYISQDAYSCLYLKCSGKMVWHTSKILRSMLQDFLIVPDYFGGCYEFEQPLETWENQSVEKIEGA